MSKIADTERVNITDNEGVVGGDNTVEIKGKSDCDYNFLSGCLDSFIKSLSLMTTIIGGVGQNAAMGNTADIEATNNTVTGRIGAENKYKVEGELFLVLLGWYETI